MLHLHEFESLIAVVTKDDKVHVVTGELLAKEAERALLPRRPAEPDPGNAGGGRFAKSCGTRCFGESLSYNVLFRAPFFGGLRVLTGGGPDASRRT